jgi:hypothetical protein
VCETHACGPRLPMTRSLVAVFSTIFFSGSRSVGVAELEAAVDKRPTHNI